MLAAGRSLPAGAAARRAAAAKSILVSKSSAAAAARCSGLGIRTLSSESTPGTVAGARAAASAGAAPASSGGSGGSSGGGSGGAGGGGGGGGGMGAAATRLVVAATVVVGMDMIAYAKIPIVKDAVDSYLSGPLPPEVYDIYRRCGVYVAYPPGKGRPTREAWDFGISRKVAEKARQLSPFSSKDKDAKPNEKSKAGGYELEATTGLNKSFSISTPPWGERTIDSEENSNPLSAADAPTPASSGVEATASSVETPAASSWQNGTIGSGTPSAETDHDSSSISSRSGGSSDALDFIGSVDAGVEGAVESVQEKAQEATDAVAAGEAWITGEESPPVAVQEVEEAVTSEASRLSDVASAAAGAAGSAAKQAEEAAGSALSAASSVVSAAAGATGDALSSSTEVVKSVAGDVIGSVESPEAAGGGGGSSSGTPEEEGSPKEQGADEAQAQMTEEDNTSPMAVALKEKEEREAAAREEIEGKKRRIRNEALSSVAEEMEVASAGLKRELEQSMLKDLKDLDEDSLRFRVAQLATELQERTKWEALRLMDGVQKKEAEIAHKYETLLSEQKEMYDTETGRALREQEQELSTSFIEKYGEQLRLHLENQANEFREALHVNAVASREALEQELNAKHADAVAELRQEEIEKSERVVAELNELAETTEAKIMEVEAARSAEEADRAASDRVHRVTHATLSLAERFASSAPVKKELDNLRRLAGGDELLEAAAGAIPEEAAAKGIPTVPQLKQRFGVVKAECRRAALVPEQAGNGMVGQLVASALSKLTFAPKGMVEGGGAEGVLARADYLLEAGELESAVGELEKLDGLPADIAMDWLKDAKTRLTADEALRVIRCHASILNAKYLKGLDGKA